MIDERTVGFADFSGSRQYISVDNLGGNNRSFLLLMDCAHLRRIGLWGQARIVEDKPLRAGALLPELYSTKHEHAISLEVNAWGVNCPQYIPQKFDAAGVALP